MKFKIIYLSIFWLSILFLSSCKAPVDYIQYVSKKENIIKDASKSVTIIGTNSIKVMEFKNTFAKNFETEEDFKINFINKFSDKLKTANLFNPVKVNQTETNVNQLKDVDFDYLINFSNIEITNKVVWHNNGGMGMNGIGMQTQTSTEYCVVTVKVEIYNKKTNQEVLDFIAKGEDAVFLFNFTKTLEKAVDQTIDHIINYLTSGKTTY